MLPPEAYLDHAQRLLRSASTEIDWRMAAARSYYAVFHLVRIDLDVPIGKADAFSVHSKVASALFSDRARFQRHLVEAQRSWTTLKRPADPRRL